MRWPKVLLGCLLSTSLGWAQEVRTMVGELRGVTTSGETLLDIAQANRLAIDHIAFANGFPVTAMKIAPGSRVVVPSWRILPKKPPRNGIVINLPERGLYLFREGRYAGFYPVSIGDEVLDKGRFWTRTGQFSIIEKQKNPTWYPPGWAPDRTPVGPGPKNPLGDRWIGLSLNRTGIHGTNDPMNVGNSVTHGCMRTYPGLVRELFDKVQVGWPARIEYEVCKVGRGPNGRLYMATFPDVYGRVSPAVAARNALSRLGIAPKRDNFLDIMALGTGYPVSLDGIDAVQKELARSIQWDHPVVQAEE